MAVNIRELLSELNEAQSRVAKAISFEEKGKAVSVLEKMMDKIQEIYPQLNSMQQIACDLQMQQGARAHRHQVQANQTVVEKPVVRVEKNLDVGFDQFKKQARDTGKQVSKSAPTDNQEQDNTPKPMDPKAK